MSSQNDGRGGRPTFTDQEALLFHSQGRPGKLEVVATKPMATQRDLSLAYSPGVAVPVLAIAENEDLAFDYTTKGNFVAVITNGTAILGLGNRGALAAKPVMEGKAVLFKRFADIDSIDLEVSSEDPDEIVNCIKLLGKSWGGINLEDIRAPECFVVEQRLQELLDIPVFHDDQHGTAIIAAAGLINALDLTGRDIKSTKLVCNGAGAAGIACLELLKAIGFTPDNIILCDTKGVIYQGRTEGMNQWKSAHAAKTSARTLAQALAGADVFFGLSVKGAVTKDMVKSMAAKPIIFAMANPDPEITAEEVAEVRSDAIMATGRSDYPNQVNNVLGFPYIFRGALDVRATAINMEMKIAAAKALAALAREDVPDEVAAAYGARPKYGPEYIIPVPFDPRLISFIPPAIASAAMETGVARRPIVDMDAYRAQLRSRRDPVAGILQRVYERLRRGLCRGRGRAGDPRRRELRQRGPRHRTAGRPRGPRARKRAPPWHRARRRHRDHQRAAVATQRGLLRLSLRATAAPRLSAARRPAPRQSGPQPFRRLHGVARRRRCHGDRGHAQLLGGAR
jgi:malate dehydrogenase (oxaloacetate-decarboxylating)(NADP+)